MRYRYALLFLLATWGLVLPAQTYQPVFANDFSEELVFKSAVTLDSELVISDLTVVNLEVLDGFFYRRAFLRPGFEPDRLIGWVREDAAAGQLFFRDFATDEEVLVYDISLEVGDSLQLPLTWCDGLPAYRAAYVVAIDAVEGRRRLWFDRTFGNGGSCDTLQFVEGVGPNATPVFPHFPSANPVEGTAIRLCHLMRNFTIEFPLSSGTDFCGQTVTDVTEAAVTNWTVYPNPFRDVLHLQGLPAGSRVVLLDGYGRQLTPLVRADDALAGRQLAPGMYLLQVVFPDGSRAVRKVVRQ